MIEGASKPVPVVLHRTVPQARVLVAIPAFNESTTIGSVVLKARQFATDIVVIDDGSTDDTAEVAEFAGALVIRHRENRGYGAALRSCFAHGRESDADVMVVLDADGQHNPTEIPTVLQPVLTGRADISIGSRFVHKSGSGVPRYRRIGIGFLTILTNLGTRNGTRLRDAQSGFRAYSRRALEVIDPHDADMGASAEIIWEANRNGLRVAEVPIEITYAENARTRNPLEHGLSVVGSMIRYIELEHPLLFFAVPGMVLTLLGIGLGYFVLDVYHRGLGFPIGWALVTVLVLLLGMLLAFTGLILHAVINASKRLS